MTNTLNEVVNIQNLVGHISNTKQINDVINKIKKTNEGQSKGASGKSIF